jgi:hypothetical protein
LSPGDSRGSPLDPDTVAHEHRSFFFPDNGHGAANAAGFGWRDGDESPFAFFILFYLFSSPLGGRKKNTCLVLTLESPYPTFRMEN